LPIADLPAVFVVADSHSNNQLSFAQSPVTIRHSLPFFVLADSHSNNLPVANRQSPFANRCRFRRGCLGRTAVRPYTIRYSTFATRCRFHQSLFASRYSPPFQRAAK
jgi:hypothetical protein